MLLALDTATPLVTVALHDGERVVAERLSERPMLHGEQLAPLVAAVLADAGTDRRALTGLAVGVGPGPFTGLRVGLVTARTLGLALGVPVHGVCTLDAIAAEAAALGHPDLLVATDARRKEVYVATYREARRTDGPHVVRPGDAATDGPVAGAGPGLYPDSFPRGVLPDRPSAGWLARVVVDDLAPVVDPEPLYLRRPDAVAPGAPKPVSDPRP